MAVEIERKFLVVNDEWRQGDGEDIVQGYLAREEHHSVRVRLRGDQGFLTIKGHTTGITRTEFEYEISADDARQLLMLSTSPLIQKIRRVIDVSGTRWEVDEFLGENQGLVVAEVELKSEDQPFTRPSWLGAEVSRDPRYLNSNLVERPFRMWPASQ